jgi:hypothetical protein
MIERLRRRNEVEVWKGSSKSMIDDTVIHIISPLQTTVGSGLLPALLAWACAE